MAIPLHLMVFGVSGTRLGHAGAEDDDTLQAVQTRGQGGLEQALEGRASATSLVLEDRTLQVRWLPLRSERNEVIGVAALIDPVSRDTSAEQELAKRRDFESLVLGLSTHFTDLLDTDIDRGIQQALEELGRQAAADRAYVFRFSDDGAMMVNTHDWCKEGFEPQSDELQSLPTSAFRW